MPESAGSFFGEKRGAVSLTFDDGTANQLLHAIPALRERGLRATFYLNPRDRIMRHGLPAWQAVAAEGHEIGNHTLSHPCPSAITGSRGLEDMSLEEIEQDILAAQERLNVLAPHQTSWSFAYPCYSTYVGRGLHRRSYVPVIARHFSAGRAGGEYGFANRPDVLDPAALVGMPVERLSADEVMGLIERFAADDQWAILVFHDIESGTLPVLERDFHAVLDYLAGRQDRMLVAPLVEVAAAIAASRYARSETTAR